MEGNDKQKNWETFHPITMSSKVNEFVSNWSDGLQDFTVTSI